MTKTKTKKKFTWGGPRPGSGAKKKDDKKKTVALYIFESVINAHGGKYAVKEKAEKYIADTMPK